MIRNNKLLFTHFNIDDLSMRRARNGKPAKMPEIMNNEVFRIGEACAVDDE
jgi:hypothetical protein